MIDPQARIDPTAIVHPTAVIEGNIRIGPYSYIGSHVTLHGDVTIDAYTHVGAGTAMVGIIDIGREVNICLNCSIRGAQGMKIGSHVSIFDNVNIESGRGWHWQDEACIEDWCWINHGAVMHGAAIREGAVVGMGATLNYNTKVGRGAIVGDGSAVPVGMVVPDGALAQGVPAQIVQRDLTDEDRVRIMGLDTREILRSHGQKNIDQGHCGWQQIRM
jgi:carbonic anhydrase/acetyltransferase-like protein (isoleucine patch superfamily)